MSRNFPFQHFLKPSMLNKMLREEEEQLEFDALSENSMIRHFDEPFPTFKALTADIKSHY